MSDCELKGIIQQATDNSVQIKAIKILFNHIKKTNRGSGFVAFAERKDVATVIEKCDGKHENGFID
jgi:hypothetical protein